MKEDARRTKIICTLGPASENRIKELSAAGMDIARINIAYTSKTKIDFENVMVDVRHWKLIPEFELPKRGVVALSFVRSGECVKNAREYTSHPICAKIETKDAVKNLGEIVRESDLIMIARGDLGKEFGVHLVPLLQERIILECKRKEKPFIVATEVLASMLSNPFPTRAEAVDVFTAVREGAYGIMLAEETAIGKYPVEATKWLKSLIDAAENGCDFLLHRKF